MISVAAQRGTAPSVPLPSPQVAGGPAEPGWAWREMAGAALRDRRCRQSLARICDALVQQPHFSFSAACGPALRQAACRIVHHPETRVNQLLAGHFQQTAQRCREYPLVLAVQDTTSLQY